MNSHNFQASCKKFLNDLKMPTWFRASDGDDSQGRDVLKKTFAQASVS